MNGMCEWFGHNNMSHVAHKKGMPTGMPPCPFCTVCVCPSPCPPCRIFFFTECPSVCRRLLSAPPPPPPPPPYSTQKNTINNISLITQKNQRGVPGCTEKNLTLWSVKRERERERDRETVRERELTKKEGLRFFLREKEGGKKSLGQKKKEEERSSIKERVLQVCIEHRTREEKNRSFFLD